jgi:hypothetical protein
MKTPSSLEAQSLSKEKQTASRFTWHEGHHLAISGVSLNLSRAD